METCGQQTIVVAFYPLCSSYLVPPLYLLSLVLLFIDPFLLVLSFKGVPLHNFPFPLVPYLHSPLYPQSPISTVHYFHRALHTYPISTVPYLNGFLSSWQPLSNPMEPLSMAL